MHHCWFNGKISPANQTQININDLGLMRGYGLFDYFRTYNQKPFQWDWYWERYEKSAKQLRIANPIKKDEAFEIVTKLISMHGQGEVAIRFILTGGYSYDSVTSAAPNLMIVSEGIHYAAPIDYVNGIKVMTYEYVRDLPTIKSIDYKHYMILQSDLKQNAAADVLYYKNGEISELSRSNVFLINNDKLITPDSNILEGITRRTVLELAKGEFDIEIRPVMLSETLTAQEVFTTSTTKRVLPISQIDNTTIGSGKIGPGTQILLDKINHLVENW